MKICFHENAWEDYLYWHQNDKKLFRRLNDLIKAICRDPFEGIGKPEKLKYSLEGAWSRRLDREHRLVYQVKEANLIILQCRYHY